jgi:hypothetical protein
LPAAARLVAALSAAALSAAALSAAAFSALMVSALAFSARAASAFAASALTFSALAASALAFFDSAGETGAGCVVEKLWAGGAGRVEGATAGVLGVLEGVVVVVASVGFAGAVAGALVAAAGALVLGWLRARRIASRARAWVSESATDCAGRREVLSVSAATPISGRDASAAAHKRENGFKVCIPVLYGKFRPDAIFK